MEGDAIARVIAASDRNSSESAWRLARRLTAALVAASLFLGSGANAARAALIGAEQVAAAEAARKQSNFRARLLGALERSDVAAALVARGVDPVQARLRVMALTDSEAAELSRRIDAAPAAAYWLTPIFVASLIVVLMYIINRLDAIDRLLEAWAGMSSEAK